jgi:iron only hydrogenase large subunit-like protein
MIAQNPKQLIGARDKVLSTKELEKIFTSKEIQRSTYSNRYGLVIRLFNRYEDQALVSALYSYEKEYIIHFQRTYSNVTTYKIEKAGTKNRVVDMILYDTVYPNTYAPHNTNQPPLPSSEL